MITAAELEPIRQAALPGGKIVVGVAGSDKDVELAARDAAGLWSVSAVPAGGGRAWQVRAGLGSALFVPWTAATAQDFLLLDGGLHAAENTSTGSCAAAEAAYAWSLDHSRTWEELAAANAYLIRWPSGPRVEVGIPRASALLCITPPALIKRLERGPVHGRQTDLGVLIPWAEMERMRAAPPSRGRPPNKKS